MRNFSGTAGAQFNFTVRGANATIHALANYANVSMKKVLTAVKKSLYILEAESIRLVAGNVYWKNPIDTRRMIGSITNQLVEFNFNRIEGKAGTNVEYAIYVHQGTRLMKIGAENRGKPSGVMGERPFLTDALHNKKELIIKMVIDAYKQDLYR